jgi:transcriptional regulator with XRE-family HTH domain
MEKRLYLNPTPMQLKAARTWLGWTLEDAAEASDVNRQTVSRIETGTSRGTRDSIMALVRAYSRAGVWMDDGHIIFEQPAEEEAR